MEMPPYGSRGKLLPRTLSRTFPPLPQDLENPHPSPPHAGFPHSHKPYDGAIRCESEQESEAREDNAHRKQDTVLPRQCPAPEAEECGTLLAEHARAR